MLTDPESKQITQLPLAITTKGTGTTVIEVCGDPADRFKISIEASSVYRSVRTVITKGKSTRYAY